MTQTKNSTPAENPWDSYFLNGESVSDDLCLRMTDWMIWN